MLRLEFSQGLKANQNFSDRNEKADNADPAQSISKLAKKCNVSHRTISRAVNEDFGMSCYVRTHCNFLIRVKRFPKLLNHLKNKEEKCFKFFKCEKVRYYKALNS